MARIALGLEYDGTDFVGWQSQGNGRSVQSALTEAVSRVADEPVVLHAAGRTDAGVHASGQVVHFDTWALRDPREWTLGINSNLPADVSVSWVSPVPGEFDARRSALSRTYRYLVLQRPTRSALAARRAWWLRETLDPAVMLEAAHFLLGENDFSSFRAAGCQSTTPWRRLSHVGIAVQPDLLAAEFTANAFVYRMVRNLMGFLTSVGAGRLAAVSAREVLAARDRSCAPATAPAHGLTLIDVEYPGEFGLPRSGRDTISVRWPR